jgi:superfamily II DNA or RNA helicase/HKD family nuclease
LPSPLREGIYEHLLTRVLETGLAAASPARAELGAIDRADLPRWIARHFARELEGVLRDASTEEKQLAIVHGLLDRLVELAPSAFLADDAADAKLAEPPRILRALYRAAAPLRPTSPLSSSTLLTRARTEPSLGHELAREIGSADRIDILAAFITTGGVRAVRPELEAAVRRGARIRVLTTVFTGTTEVSAVDALSALEHAEVRISYDTRRTRLHAKAWLFARDTGLHTAYVGSANLTATALGTGQEWMVKVCAADLPQVIDKFEGTFEGLWNDLEFERYDATSDADRAKLRAALKAEKQGETSVVALFTLQAFPFQLEILDRLAAERALHGRFRNLVVAATGTGKTVIAAFDYLRACERAGTRPRLLFLAHRREILEQARATFRQVLRDGAFGELYVDGDLPEKWEHVFATVQSAAGHLRERTAADHFRFVVVDECHHAPARSYQEVMTRLRPEILLGLTATPERSDGKSLLPDFDGRIAAELRLWHALDRQLLVPFEYYGIADASGTELDGVRWSRTGYQTSDLSNLYTGNEIRVDLIVEQLRRRVVDTRAIRALAFCVSVEHAEFMAKALTKRGIPAEVVHGGTEGEQRTRAPRRLRDCEVNVLCTCDLYNEGVDLPFVDTLLLLRPTSSATLFVQQIGRGLRLFEGKSTCLVLDFIGQHRAEFRFDGVYAAITGIPRGRLERDVKEGFPYLPSGCVFQLDAVVTKRVLESLKQAVATAAVLARELREMASGAGASEGQGRGVTLARFLDESGRDVEDVYRESVGGWTALRARAGVIDAVDDDTADLSRRLDWLLHTDDATRLAMWKTADGTASSADPSYARRLTMLDFQLNHRGVLREPVDVAKWLFERAPIRDELAQLADVLDERLGLAEETYPVAEWPLALHRHYTRREIVAAVGFVKPGKKGVTPQSGILMLPEEKREIMFVTLDKSASSFSPSTRYRDYAISPTLFHWETQSAASVARPSGRRYLESPKNGWLFFLFVRSDPDAPYAFLGPVRLESASGDRPIGITWRLEHAMSGGLFDKFATLAQG